MSTLVDVAAIPCGQCSRSFDPVNAECPKCIDRRIGEATEDAVQESRCDLPHAGPVGEAVRDWLTAERLKVATDITPEIARIFERCAEDLEVGG